MRRCLPALLVFLFALPSAAAQEVAEIADGVHVLSGQARPDIQPDGNSLLFRGRTGWIVFDTGRHPAHTGHILDFVARSGKPVVAVINSHWHLDHTSGNRHIAARYPGAALYATDAVESALEGFLLDYDRQLAGVIDSTTDDVERVRLQAERDTIHADEHLRPDVVLEGCGERAIDGRPFVICVTEHAVTSGDAWLLDIETGVLAAGDLVTLPAPFLDTACPEDWRDALRELLEADFATLVPGHGPAMTLADVEHYAVAFDDLLACAASERSAAQCSDAWIDDVGSLFTPAEDAAYARALLSYYFDNHLRADRVNQGALCRGDGV